MLKIFHTADLHLDTAFSTLDFSAGENARDEQRKVFAAAMRYVKENNFDMVLIAGDLFDGRYVTGATAELVIECFSSLSCPVVISPGNHDPYSAIALYKSGKLPQNVYVFSSEEMQVFDFDELGVSVCGYAFNTDRVETSPLRSFTPPVTDNMLLLCAHADITSPTSKYAPLSVGDIERCGFVYSALGHIHNAPEIETRTGAVAKYCGFLMGRGFDEDGIGGALEVRIDEGRVDVSRVEFTKRQYVTRTLDVSHADSIDDIEKKISEAISSWGYGPEASLCIELCGVVSMELDIREDALSAISVPTALLKVKNITIPMPDADYLEFDLSLKGEFYRTLLPKLRSDSAEERRVAFEALRIGMCAIEGRNLADILLVN